MKFKLFFILLFSSSIAFAHSESSELWNLENADIRTIIKAVSKETGKNFLIDPRVEGKVSFVSNHSFRSEDTYTVFLTLLNSLHYSAIPDDMNKTIIKIIPTSALAKNENETTQIIHLHYLQATAIAPTITKLAQNITLKTQSSEISHFYDSTVTVEADANTNSLIITGATKSIQKLNKLISQLDICPKQILVEGIIVELNQENLKNIGIQWGSRSSNQESILTGSFLDFPLLGAGVVGLIPQENIKAILNALENISGANILSTPTIVVLDNQPAFLEIGKEVPQQTGSYATTTNISTITPFNTIERKPVTLSLNVIPQINLNHSVKLKLELKNNSLQNPDSPGLNPIVNTSRISNTVIINTHDILVIGGLISQNITENIIKVPILSNIPLLGTLFQTKKRELEKKNLMIFIKVNILNDQTESKRVTQEYYHQSRILEEKWSATSPSFKNKLPIWKDLI